MKYKNLPGVVSVYRDEYQVKLENFKNHFLYSFSQNCRLTYRILLKFDGRYMTPVSLPHYQVWDHHQAYAILMSLFLHYYLLSAVMFLQFKEWSSLNYMYGVVNVSYHQKDDLIAHLEFEPGLYTNHQMKVSSHYLTYYDFSLIDILGHKKWIFETERSDVWMGWGNISKQWYKE